MDEWDEHMGWMGRIYRFLWIEHREHIKERLLVKETFDLRSPSISSFKIVSFNQDSFPFIKIGYVASYINKGKKKEMLLADNCNEFETAWKDLLAWWGHFIEAVSTVLSWSTIMQTFRQANSANQITSTETKGASKCITAATENSNSLRKFWISLL